MYTKGYEPKHIRSVSLDDSSVLDGGIDHVFKNPQTGEFVVVESKFNSSTLNPNTEDGPQMGFDWIEGSNRLQDAVGNDLADEIIDTGYTRVLAKVSQINGYIVYIELDQFGQPICTWIP